ncbi:MAG: transposase [Gammaproteobacteria bacterium]|nr:transposase [Gammaproteobacteria bacterium]
MPPGDADYAGRWRRIKAEFTRALSHTGVGITKNAKGEYDLWQRRYWEHTLRDETDFSRHVDYIHYNLVTHGWVKRVREWPYSTFYRYVRLGIYSHDWANNYDINEGEFGE